MAINKKLIFWNNSSFNPPTSSTDTTQDVLWNTIVFFGPNSGHQKEIWTHGVYFSSPIWGTETADYVPVTISGVTKNLSLNGHTHSYLPLNGGTITGSISVSESITNLSHDGGGIFWNPYAESDSDPSDVASISVNTSGSSTVMTIKQLNDWGDYINFLVNSNTNGVRINDNPIYHAGNFNPGNYLQLSGGTMTDSVFLPLDTPALRFGNARTWDSAIAHDTASYEVEAFMTKSTGTKYRFKVGFDPISFTNGSFVNMTNADLEIGAGYCKINNNTVWHAGNMGTGSGLDADLLDGYHAGFSNGKILKLINFPAYSYFGSSTDSYDYYQNIIKWVYNNANDGDTTLAIGVGHPNSIGNLQIQLYGTSGYDSTTNFPRYSSAIYYPLGDTPPVIFGTDNYTYYQYTIARTTDNVASATKLQTTRTIWGQNFDGNSDVDGLFRNIINGDNQATFKSLVYPASPYGLVGYSHPDGSYWLQSQRENSNEVFSLLLNPNGGNVGIGTTSSNYKLDVNGNAHIADTVDVGGVLQLSNSGLKFADNAFGGGGDIAKMYLATKGGEATTMTFEVENDSDDTINFITPSSTGLTHNNNIILDTGNLTGTQTGHTHNYAALSNLVVAGNEHNWVPNGYSGDMWINYQDRINRDSTALIGTYHFGNGRSGYANLTANLFSGNGANLTSLNASNISSGTIGNDRLPQRLINYTSQYYVDPNNFRDSGFAYTGVNLPANVGDANILGIFHTSGGWGHQLAFKFGGGGATGSSYDGKDIYTRIYKQDSAYWTPWYVLLSSGNYSNILNSTYRPMGGNWSGNGVPGTREFGYTTNDGSGEVAFKSNNGTMNMIIDGSIYVTDNSYEVIHTGNINNQSVNYANTSGSTAWLNANSALVYGNNGFQYFNTTGSAGAVAGVNDTPTNAWWHIARFNHGNTEGYYTDLAIPFLDNSIYYKRISSGTLMDGGWIKVLDAINYNSYSPTLSGTGAWGTWNINITGNASNASNISNTGTVTLASATESNAITITQPSYATDQPVKLLNFNWYTDAWSIGNIRSGNTPSNGLGIFLNSVEKFRFINGVFKIGTNTAYHAGNFSVTLNGTSTTSASFYAPTSQLSVQSSIQSYLIGASSTTSLGTVYSNAGIYMNGSKLYTGDIQASGNITASNLWGIATKDVSLTLTTDWQDTGILMNDSTLFASGAGTYVIELYSNTPGVSAQYEMRYSGVMAVFRSQTNNSTDTDEITLHSMGHASNARQIYLRTALQVTPNYAKIQIASSAAWTDAGTITIKTRRII